MIWCLGLKACRILAPLPGMEPALPALEGDILATGLPATFSSSVILKLGEPEKQSGK